MAIVVKSEWQADPTSVDAKGAHSGLKFNIRTDDRSTLDEADALAALSAEAPTTLAGMIRSGLTVERVGPEWFRGVVAYSTLGAGDGVTPVDAPTGTPPEEEPPALPAPATPDIPLGSGYAFQWGAELTHKTVSLGMRQSRVTGDTAVAGFGTGPKYNGLVGLRRNNGQVSWDGYDSPSPTFQWSRTFTYPYVTLNFLNTIRGLIGKKNKAAFYGRAAGEVVLWGATGQNLFDYLYSITYTFYERSNLPRGYCVVFGDDDPQVGLQNDERAAPGNPPPDPGVPPAADTVAGAICLDACSGWDHIWVEYEEEIAEGRLSARAIAAHVEKVVRDGDFSLLKIGA